ncbi:MAG: hypothetical protein WCI04_05455 [archaeon]
MVFFCFFIIPKSNVFKHNSKFSSAFCAGQSSLEYLLILAAFFAVFGIIFPVIVSSSEQFMGAEDVLLAKRIASEVEEKSSLFAFVGDGSKWEFVYYPIKEITVFSQGEKVIFESQGKQFVSVTNSPQFIVRESFSSKFKIVISKIQNTVQVVVNIVE